MGGKNEDVGGGWRTGWRGLVECLQSCRVDRKGESGGKNSFGDSLALVECAADAKLASLAKHRRTPRSPAESFPPPSPGGKSHRTEDRGRNRPVRHPDVGWLNSFFGEGGYILPLICCKKSNSRQIISSIGRISRFRLSRLSASAHRKG